jgi:hypothetical protein
VAAAAAAVWVVDVSSIEQETITARCAVLCVSYSGCAATPACVRCLQYVKRKKRRKEDVGLIVRLGRRRRKCEQRIVLIQKT